LTCFEAGNRNSALHFLFLETLNPKAGSGEFSEESVNCDLRGSEELLLCAEIEHLLHYFFMRD